MREDELIVLDARLIAVVDRRAFRAQLGNGHGFVAYWRGEIPAGEPALQPGDQVRVRMSPFDMSAGQIILDTNRADHEG